MDPHGHAAAWLALRTPQPIPSVLPCSENPPLLRKPLSTTPHTWRTSQSIPQPPASSWLTGHPNPSPYASTPTNPCTTLIPSWLSAHPNPPPCPLRGLRGHPSPSPFPPRFEGHSNHTLKISSKLPGCPNPSLHTLPLLDINPNPTPYPPSPLLAWRTPRPSLSPTPAPYPGTRCRSLWTGRSRQRPHPAAGGSPAAPQTCGKGGSEQGWQAQGAGGSPSTGSHLGMWQGAGEGVRTCARSVMCMKGSWKQWSWRVQARRKKPVVRMLVRSLDMVNCSRPKSLSLHGERRVSTGSHPSHPNRGSTPQPLAVPWCHHRDPTAGRGHSLAIIEASQVLPVHGELIKLVSVVHDEHQHGVGHHQPPKALEHLAPQAVVHLRGQGHQQGHPGDGTGPQEPPASPPGTG